MHEYEEQTDIIGSPCTLLEDFRGYTEGIIVGECVQPSAIAY